MDIDVAVLRKALDHITAHPEEWSQEFWVSRRLIAANGREVKGGEAFRVWQDSDKQATECGTACCLAGTVVSQAGLVPVFPSYAFQTARVVVDHTVTKIITAAQDLLGLTVEQAKELFSANNSLAGLWRLANKLTEGEIEIPPQFAPDRRGVYNHNV